MSDWNAGPDLAQTYSAFVSSIDGRLNDAAMMFDGAGTNLPDDTIKWDTGTSQFQQYSSASTEWNPLAPVFQMTVSAANNLAGYSGGVYVRSSVTTVLATAVATRFGILKTTNQAAVDDPLTINAAVTPWALHRAQGHVFTNAKRSATTQDWTSNTTYADASGLTFTNLPVGNYSIESHLFVRAGSGGLKIQDNLTDCTNWGWSVFLNISTDADTGWTNTSYSISDANVTDALGGIQLIGGYLNVYDATNSFAIQLAQHSADVTPLKLYRGSWVKMTRLPD